MLVTVVHPLCFAPRCLRPLLRSTAAQERDRAKIPDKYKWNLADIYPSEEAWRTAKERWSRRSLS